MRTRILLTTSGLYMLALGLVASFFPQDVLTYATPRPSGLGILLVQTTGALYAGFGVVNWAARGTLLGWDYNRPLALGNFLHFTMDDGRPHEGADRRLAQPEHRGLRGAVPAVRRLVRADTGQPSRSSGSRAAPSPWGGAGA
jgi:hypothetical protein